MKVKLLKKVRKRFEWKISKHGLFAFFDNVEKEAIEKDVSFIMRYIVIVYYGVDALDVYDEKIRMREQRKKFYIQRKKHLVIQ